MNVPSLRFRSRIRWSAPCAALLLPVTLSVSLAQTPPAPTPPAKSPPTSAPAAPEAPKSNPQAVAVVDRYLEAIGGKATQKAITDKVTKFVNKKFTPTDVQEMRMSRFLKRELKIREEWELPGLSLSSDSNEPLYFVQVYNGESAWVKTMGVVQALEGKTLTVFVWDKYIDDYFMQWEQDGYTLESLPAAELQGKTVDVVEAASFAGGQKVRYYFSREDGLLLKKEWTEPTGRGLTKKEVFYTDYLRVRFRNDPDKWIKMAANEKIFEDNELVLEKVYSEIVVNGGLDDKIFERPDGPTFGAGKKDESAAPAPAPGTTTQPAPGGTTTKPAGQ
ncbi:MAG: hypothetical protein AB7O52_16095 [Planctomycetota bacterium]